MTVKMLTYFHEFDYGWDTIFWESFRFFHKFALEADILEIQRGPQNMRGLKICAPFNRCYLRTFEKLNINVEHGAYILLKLVLVTWMPGPRYRMERRSVKWLRNGVYIFLGLSVYSFIWMPPLLYYFLLTINLFSCFMVHNFRKHYRTSESIIEFQRALSFSTDRLCSLVVRVSGYRSRGPGSIPVATIFFFRSSRSGTGSTQPREYNWGATWKKE
jgi:hypothetical protein